MKTISKLMVMVTCTLLFTSLNILSQSADSTANDFSDSLLCLEINGKITNKDKKKSTYKAILIHYNTPVDSVIVKGNKSFTFSLMRDAYYAIKIYKAGYAPKLISISTCIPKEELDGDLLRFHFKTALIPEHEFNNLNEEVKDFPIAVVLFLKSKKNFYYNEKYTYNIKRTLYTKN